MSEQLFDKKWIAVGIRTEKLDDRFGRFTSAQRSQHLADPFPRESAECDPLDAMMAKKFLERLHQQLFPRNELEITKGRDDHDRQRGHELRQVVEQEQGSLVGPLDIVDEKQCRSIV